MIISASRRTDIPAFYAKWFMNRIRAGYCAVPNPFNRDQVSHVSLNPEDVDVIVLWTRNARPLLPRLAELDERGYRYYFQYTLMDNPHPIEAKSPPLEASQKTFRALADRIGPDKAIWRYDPIVFSNVTGPEFHQKTYEHIAQALRGHSSLGHQHRVFVKRKRTQLIIELEHLLRKPKWLPVLPKKAESGILLGRKGKVRIR